MGKTKKRPQGIAVHSEDAAIAIARKRARWSMVPPAFQMEQGEVVDPQEKLDALNEQDRRDLKDFRQGIVNPCWFTKQIRKEERLEQREAQMHA